MLEILIVIALVATLAVLLIGVAADLRGLDPNVDIDGRVIAHQQIVGLVRGIAIFAVAIRKGEIDRREGGQHRPRPAPWRYRR